MMALSTMDISVYDASVKQNVNTNSFELKFAIQKTLTYNINIEGKDVLTND